MLLGRLGIENARVPHVDRHGLVLLDRGTLSVEDGALTFRSAGGGNLEPGRYAIPQQAISMILLGPGTSITHDVLRILARAGTGLVAVGDDGIRLYTAPPFGTGESELARQQARLWADERRRIAVARQMYALRLGEIFPHKDIDTLRGIEGARVKATYGILAAKHGINWDGRRYDRADPQAADLPNQAINHASSALEAAAAIAVAATGTIPQLGFIHETSSAAFALDISDLYRATVTVDVAFQSVAEHAKDPSTSLERLVRKGVGRRLRRDKIIPDMIDRIKLILAPK